jgi:hypothetical protein
LGLADPVLVAGSIMSLQCVISGYVSPVRSSSKQLSLSAGNQVTRWSPAAVTRADLDKSP